MSEKDKPGWALAHYVVADHYKIPLDDVVDTGWIFEEDTEVWRREVIRSLK